MHRYAIPSSLRLDGMRRLAGRVYQEGPGFKGACVGFYRWLTFGACKEGKGGFYCPIMREVQYIYIYIYIRDLRNIVS